MIKIRALKPGDLLEAVGMHILIISVHKGLFNIECKDKINVNSSFTDMLKYAKESGGFFAILNDNKDEIFSMNPNIIELVNDKGVSK